MAHNWKTASIGAVADYQTGFPFKSEFYTDSRNGVRLLRGDNIVQGALRWDDAKYWPSSDVENYGQYQLREGDVVLAMDRPWIAAGWKVGGLDSLGDIVGGSTPSTKEDRYFTEHGIPWITPKDLSRNAGNKFITRGGADLTEEGVKSASLSLLPAGSVLMSSRAPIGYTAINRIPATTNQGFKSFVPTKGFPVEFIYHTLNHLMKIIEQNASGSTFKEVSATTLKTIQTELPDKQILNSFARVLQPVFAQQDNLELQNQELAALRDWLLPMLMNGQVTVG